MPISTINQNGLTNPLTSVAANTVTSAAATALTLQSAGTTAVTISTAQNVGIGTTSPTFPVGTGLEVSRTGGVATIQANRSDASIAGSISIQGGSGQNNLYSTGAKPLVLYTDATERMRITSGGDLLVGTTSSIARIGAVFDGNTNNGCVLRTSTNASGTGFLYFQQDTTSCGSVVRVGTTSAVTYATTSDYRLKENIVPMAGALARVLQLNPVTYTWKQGGESAEGFIAHELAEVCPDAVVGTKDQVETYIDDEGNEQTRPKYQGVDTSFLVATLTAAIQELKAEFDAYKASHP